MFIPSPKDNKVSTEWAKYSSIEQIKDNATQGLPEDYSVVEIEAGNVRSKCNLEVEHAPYRENYAHTNIEGFPDSRRARLKARRKLARCARFSEPLLVQN